MANSEKLIKKNFSERRNIKKILTRDQIHAIQIISGPKNEDEEGFQIYGSINYKPQPYPSDVDGSQNYTFCKKYPCTKNDSSKKVIPILRETVKNIMNSKKFFLGDIKIGVDTQIQNILFYIHDSIYPQSINKQWTTHFKNNKLISEHKKNINEYQIPQLLIHGYQVNYPSSSIMKLWQDAYDQGIISLESLNEIKKLIPSKIKGKQGINKFFLYCEFIRQLYLLRWTGKEVLLGTKMIGNREISLLGAIKSAIYNDSKTGKSFDHLIKIDMFGPSSNGKLIEYSNLFSFLYKDSKSNKVLSLSHGSPATFSKGNTDTLIHDLSIDMAQYYNEVTDKFKKALKFAKRMFVISLLKKDVKVGIKLIKLFRSDINLLNYINSQIDTIIGVMTDNTYPPMDTIYNQLDILKFDLSRIIELDINQEHFYDVINKIIKGNMLYSEIIDLLTKIKKEFSSIINDNTKSYLKQQKLWPGPYYKKDNLEFVYG